ncbi:MAG: polysaccharide deacetylase family protein [Eubacteriales bacterium]
MNSDLFNNLKQYLELWETFVNSKDYSGTGSEYRDKRSDSMIPAVSDYLIEQGYRVSYPDNKKFAVCLTHDIDDIYPPLSHRVLSGLYSLKKLNFNALKEHLFWNSKQPSPYLNFKKIIELEKKYNAKSTFYFMATNLDPKRFRYNIEDIAGELGFIAESSCEVGLHGGYYSYNDIEAVKNEKSRLENVLGKKVIGYRNHYLRFQTPQTWEILEECGFEYDSTYGYTDTIGFRNGMCHPFKPYNLQRQQWMNIYELPLNVMECAMFDTVSPRNAWEPVRQLLEKAELCKGVLTVLWHNNVFGCPYREQWAALYEKILQYGREKGAWMTSCEEIWKWWTENGC